MAGSTKQVLPLGVTAVMLPDLDFSEQVSLCRELGVTHYVFRPRHIPDAARDQPWSSHGNHKFDLTPQRLLQEGPKFKAELEAAGMLPFCTVPAGTADDDDDIFKHHFEGAAAAGCTRMRVTPPAYPGQVFDYPQYLGRTIDRYQKLCGLAEPYGIKLVIEMHGNTAAVSPGLAYNIVQSFDPARLGVILDLPNFAREGFVAPHLAVSVVRPWLDHAHVGGLRRTAGTYDELGFRRSGFQMCPVTESDLDVPAWLRTMAVATEAGETCPLVIEDYTADMTGALKLRLNVEAVKRVLES